MRRKAMRQIAMNRLTLSVAIIFCIFGVSLFLVEMQTHALPEYANRTSASCAVCHVSPGGGGPLTLSGMAWVSEDRPNVVPEFGAVLLAPGVDDPGALYQIGCAGCHGKQGEGLSATPLAGFDLSESLLRRYILLGKPYFGMPGFEGKFTEQQIEVLAEYVNDLSAGRIVPPDSFPLPPGHLLTETSPGEPTRGGN